MSQPDRRSILVDAHVHIHRCFSIDRLLDNAAANFEQAGKGMGLASAPLGVLLLTESAGERYHELLRTCSESLGVQRWTFRQTGEPASLLASRADEAPLILIAGRQVCSSDGLEVLALGCEEEPPDGRPIQETLDEVRQAGALPVVPWGFGKWTFGRKRLLETVVEREDPSDFFLGDNGGRLRSGALPDLFLQAGRRGIRNLPGTDPLPFPTEVSRVGSYGFRVEGELDLQAPAASIKNVLRNPQIAPYPYGTGERLLRFVHNQLFMQLRKRRHRSAE